VVGVGGGLATGTPTVGAPTVVGGALGVVVFAGVFVVVVFVVVFFAVVFFVWLKARLGNANKTQKARTIKIRDFIKDAPNE
jgi:uncharacterized membrane protein